MTYKKNVILFGIKSVLMSKKNLIASMSIIKNFGKPDQNLMMMKQQIFYSKKIPKVDSNHTGLAVINLNSALKK